MRAEDIQYAHCVKDGCIYRSSSPIDFFLMNLCFHEYMRNVPTITAACCNFIYVFILQYIGFLGLGAAVLPLRFETHCNEGI